MNMQLFRYLKVAQATQNAITQKRNNVKYVQGHLKAFTFQ